MLARVGRRGKFARPTHVGLKRVAWSNREIGFAKPSRSTRPHFANQRGTFVLNKHSKYASANGFGVATRYYSTDAHSAAQQAPSSAAPAEQAPKQRTFISNDLSGFKVSLQEQFPPHPMAELEKAARRCQEARLQQRAKALPPEELRKAFYYHIQRGELKSAYVTFSDYWSVTKPSIFEFNVAFTWLGAGAQYSDLLKVYEYFRDNNFMGDETTYTVLMKAYSEAGDVKKCMEIYERMFVCGVIPSIECLESLLKAAAYAGDALTFQRFYERLKRKNKKISNVILKSLLDSWGTKRHAPAAPLNANAFSACIDYATRVHNFKLAVDLIEESRDMWGLQPDAYMYERLLLGALRNGYCRDTAKEWLRRLKKYPKGIERREEHFEFSDFMHNQLLPTIIKEHGGNPEAVKYAPPPTQYPTIKDTHQTRKLSKQLYKHFPRIRYTSIWEYMDKFDWVPEYKERLMNAPQVEKQRMQTFFLRQLQFAAAREELLQEKFKEVQERARERWRLEQQGIKLDMIEDLDLLRQSKLKEQENVQQQESQEAQS